MVESSAPASDANPRSGKLEALMRAAERMTVELVAQKPYCASPFERSLQETLATAEAERYDLLPVKDEDGSMTRYVRADTLATIDSWDEVDDVALPITVDLLVAESSPLFGLLSRFDATPILFVLTQNGIQGVVTVFDLNQVAAHQFAFGLALVIEAEVADVIRVELADGPRSETIDDRALSVLEANEGIVSRESLKKWKRKRRLREQIDILDSIGFAAKISLLERMDLVDELRARAGSRYNQSDDLLNDLRKQVKELRNDIAHERAGLQDHEKTFRRIRLTYELAHELVFGSDSARH